MTGQNVLRPLRVLLQRFEVMGLAVLPSRLKQELCADLVIGGTTPSLALLRQVKAETGLPVRALLRPRFGDFCYDRYRCV